MSKGSAHGIVSNCNWLTEECWAQEFKDGKGREPTERRPGKDAIGELDGQQGQRSPDSMI